MTGCEISLFWGLSVLTGSVRLGGSCGEMWGVWSVSVQSSKPQNCVVLCSSPRFPDSWALWNTASQGVRCLWWFWASVPAQKVSELLGNLCSAHEALGLFYVLCPRM